MKNVQFCFISRFTFIVDLHVQNEILVDVVELINVLSLWKRSNFCNILSNCLFVSIKCLQPSWWWICNGEYEKSWVRVWAIKECAKCLQYFTYYLPLSNRCWLLVSDDSRICHRPHIPSGKRPRNLWPRFCWEWGCGTCRFPKCNSLWTEIRGLYYTYQRFRS